MSNKNNHPVSTQSKQLVARQASRTAVSQGAKYIARETTQAAVKQGAKHVIKGAANPAFIVGDVMEIGVGKITGSKEVGKASSLAVYVGAGAAAGGPVGAGVATGLWMVGQAFDAVFS